MIIYLSIAIGVLGLLCFLFLYRHKIFNYEKSISDETQKVKQTVKSKGDQINENNKDNINIASDEGKKIDSPRSKKGNKKRKGQNKPVVEPKMNAITTSVENTLPPSFEPDDLENAKEKTRDYQNRMEVMRSEMSVLEEQKEKVDMQLRLRDKMLNQQHEKIAELEANLAKTLIAQQDDKKVRNQAEKMELERVLEVRDAELQDANTKRQVEKAQLTLLEQDKRNLDERLAQLERELVASKVGTQRVAELVKHNDTLQAQLQAAAHTNASLTKKLDKTTELEKQLADAQDFADQRVSIMTKEKEESTAQLEHVEKQMKEMNHNPGAVGTPEMELELRKTSEQFAGLTQKYAELMSEMGKKVEVIDKLENDLTTSQGINLKVGGLSQTNQELREEIQKKAEMSTELEKVVADLTNYTAQLKTTTAELTSQLGEERKKSGMLATEMSGNATKITELQKRGSTESAELTRANAELCEKNASLMTEMGVRADRIGVMERQLAQMRTDTEAVTETKKKLENDNTIMNDFNENLHERMLKLSDEFQHQSEEMKSMRIDNENYRKQIVNLMEQDESEIISPQKVVMQSAVPAMGELEYNVNRDEVTQELEKWRQHGHVLDSEFCRVQGELYKSEQINTTLRLQLETAASNPIPQIDNSVLNAKCSTLEKTLNHVKDQLNTQMKNCTDLTQKLDSTISVKTNVEKEKDNLMKEVKKLTVAKQQLENASVKQTASNTANITSEKMQKKIEAIYNDELVKMRDKNNLLDQENREMSGQLHEYKATLVRTEQMLSDIQISVDVEEARWRKSLLQSEACSQQLEIKLQDLATENEHLRSINCNITTQNDESPKLTNHQSAEPDPDQDSNMDAVVSNGVAKKRRKRRNKNRKRKRSIKSQSESFSGGITNGTLD